MAYSRSTTSSIFDGFTLNPLPYPVLLILGLISLIFGVSWYFSHTDAMKHAVTHVNWTLLAIPIVSIVIVRWFLSMQNPGVLFGLSPWDRRWGAHDVPSEGSSPWGVLALIVLVLGLLQYRTRITDNWVFGTLDNTSIISLLDFKVFIILLLCFLFIFK